MRLARSNYLALLTVVTALTMAGCSDKRADPGASPADINTHNYFTNGQSLRIFNPETKQSRQVDRFDAGPNQIAHFDTDVKKQGYEYSVYAREGSIFIKAHDKNSTGPRLMRSTGQHICGLYARKSAVVNETSSAVDDTLISQDLYIVDVETNESADCDPMTSQYLQIDFSDLTKNLVGLPRFRAKEVSSAFVHGTMLRIYRPITAKDPETDEMIRWGYIGYDIHTKTVQFYNQSTHLIWQTQIDTDNDSIPDDTIPRFFQASEDLALIQSDQNLFVRNIPQLYALGQSEGDESGGLPSNSAIRELFDSETVDLDTESADASNPVSVQGDGTNFAVKEGDNLYYYDADAEYPGFRNRSVVEPYSNVIDFEFSVFPASPPEILIKRTFTLPPDTSLHESLDAVTTDSLESSTIASGRKVHYKIIGNAIYVNTLTEVSDEGLTVPRWQAHRIVRPIKLDTSKDTYDLSMFIFAHDQRDHQTLPLMLKATETEDGALVSPIVGPFSTTQASGVYSGKVFGTINGLVENSNLPELQSFVMNDLYGAFFTQTGNTTNLYYFNLSDPKDSLSLMY